MKTVKRYNIPGCAHELTFSCYKNLPLLTSERACSHLAAAINRTSKSLHYSVYAYVFMYDHVHLIAKPHHRNYSISDYLKSVKQSVARNELKFIREHDPETAILLMHHQKHGKYRFWQEGGGYDRNITEPETLMNAIEYIHRNPIRKGFVNRAPDWKWSSAGDWLENREGPVHVEKKLFF